MAEFGIGIGADLLASLISHLVESYVGNTHEKALIESTVRQAADREVRRLCAESHADADHVISVLTHFRLPEDVLPLVMRFAEIYQTDEASRLELDDVVTSLTRRLIEAGLDTSTLGIDLGTLLKSVPAAARQRLLEKAKERGSPIYNRVSLEATLNLRQDILTAIADLKRDLGAAAPLVDTWPSVSRQQAPRQPYQWEKAYLIRYLTQSAIGRTAELTTLRSFAYSIKPAYGVLEGPAGFGKSTILASLIAEFGSHASPIDLVYVFISEISRENTAASFLMAVNSQLLDLLGERPEVGVELDLVARRNQMNALWSRAVLRATAERPLLLIIDGLDEAAMEDHSIATLLPSQLKSNCHTVISMRSASRVIRLAPAGHPVHSAITWQATALSGTAIRDLLLRFGVPIEDVDRLAARVLGLTKGEPLFARFVCEDAARDEHSLTQLERAPPDGVKQYFSQQLDLLRSRAATGLSASCVEILGVAEGGLSLEELGSLYSLPTSQIRHAIEPISRFTRGTDRIELMHLQLKIAVRDDLPPELLKSRRRELVNWCGRFAEDNWPVSTPWHVLAHGVEYFVESGDHDRLRTILGEGWVRLQLEQGLLDSAIRDLRNAFAAFGDDVEDLPDAICISLLLARLVSLGQQVPYVVLRQLARLGERERALAYAMARKGVAERFQAICHVAEGLALRGRRSEAEGLLRDIVPDAGKVGVLDAGEAMIDVARASYFAQCSALGAAMVDVLKPRLELYHHGKEEPDWLRLQELELPLALTDVWLGRADVARVTSKTVSWPAEAIAALASTIALAGDEQSASLIADEAGPTVAAAVASALQTLERRTAAREKAFAAYSAVKAELQGDSLLPVARTLAKLGNYETELREIATLADSLSTPLGPSSGIDEAWRLRPLVRAAEAHALAGESDKAWHYINLAGEHLEDHTLFVDFVLAGLFIDAQRALFLPGATGAAYALGEAAEILFSQGDEDRARRWTDLAIRLSPLLSSSPDEATVIKNLARALLTKGLSNILLAQVALLGRDHPHDALIFEIANWHANERRYQDAESALETLADEVDRILGYVKCAASAAADGLPDKGEQFVRRAEQIIETLPEASRNSARYRSALRLAEFGYEEGVVERVATRLSDDEKKRIWERYVDNLLLSGRRDEAQLLASRRGTMSRRLEQIMLQEKARTQTVDDLRLLLSQLRKSEAAATVDKIEASLSGTVTDNLAIFQTLVEMGRVRDANALLDEIADHDHDEVLALLARANAENRDNLEAARLISMIRGPRWKAIARARVFAHEFRSDSAAPRRVEMFLRELESDFTDRDRSSALSELALSLIGQPKLTLPVMRSALLASAFEGDNKFLLSLASMLPVLEASVDRSIIGRIFIRLLELSKRLI